MIQSKALTNIEPTLTPISSPKIPLQFEREKKASNRKKRSVSVNDSFETSTGLFKCPKCNEFTSKDEYNFRQHLLNEINDTM